MPRGNTAKDNLTKIIVDALGDACAGVQDRKIYAWADDGGEKVQIAISMTMPKTPLVFGEMDLAAEPVGKAEVPVNTELSSDDKAKVEELLKRLGIE